jgi:hypothetical protein
MVLRGVCSLVALLLAVAVAGPVQGRDLRPVDHGLRYVGHEGRLPVTVEVTLRERADGEFEYVRWVTPRSWASWLGRAKATRSQLQFRNDLLVPVACEGPHGVRTPPPDLAPGVIDALAVRLRARADIARGARRVEYSVWTGGEVLETWILEVSGAETVRTPDGNYETLKFRLGSGTEWIEGWSAPLLVFHFVKIVHWRDGKKIGTFELDDKQL